MLLTSITTSAIFADILSLFGLTVQNDHTVALIQDKSFLREHIQICLNFVQNPFSVLTYTFLLGGGGIRGGMLPMLIVFVNCISVYRSVSLGE